LSFEIVDESLGVTHWAFLGEPIVSTQQL
jgi:hypothetical protein